MYILGINAYHGGASACLINNGHLVAAVEEERFKRIKHWAGFPVSAIRYCLSEAGISVYDLDHIGISRNPRANMLLKARFALRQFPHPQFLLDRAKNLRRVGGLERVFCSLMGVTSNDMQVEYHNIEHHRAHLASAFFVSPFERAAVLSVDGMGDFSSTMWAVGTGSQLDVQGAIHFPHSIGIVYTAVSQWLGFTKYGDEGKVMGLASYGEPNYLERMRQMVRVQRDGTFEVDQEYLRYEAEGGTMTWAGGEPKLGRLYSDKFISEFGHPRVPGTEITRYHQDVAASLQEVIEEVEFALVRRLQQETGCKTLCMAGGVALNSVFNGKVLPETEFNDIYIQPAASDAGTALGVCYYIYHQLLGQQRSYEMRDAYTGPGFANGPVQASLEKENLHYETFDLSEIVRKVAEMVAEGKVVGWFQGRMEWGPRALGHRSIVADPRRADM
ncbi:MAG: carbamoyltransferase N-terminal domain-containing protein, partial [Gammaproteobacteria bacterium]|nr:carbamoyltransferase N-terminal domain-containing protein [Gammaproteobacteria bacterium]